MTFQYSPSRLLSASVMTAGLAFASYPALAFDADDFATKVAALATRGGAKMSFSAVEPNGDSVVLKSVRLDPTGASPKDLGDVTFEGVEEEGDGGYRAEQARFGSIDSEQDGVRLTVEDIMVSGLTIPADNSARSAADITLYEEFSTGPIAFKQGDKTLFSASGVEQRNERADDNSRVGGTLDVSDIMIDLTVSTDPKTNDAIREMGYTTVTGDLRVEGEWDIEPGILRMNEYSLTFDDVGRLNMTLEISGYTLELLEALQQAQATALANPDPQAGQQAMGLATLGLMQQLNFVSATIGFEDDSLTEKALAYAGKQQGVTGEQMGMAVKGMLPLMLGQIGIPALQQQISAAASTYLDNPGSLTVTAKPDKPVALPVLMGAGMGGNPKALVDLLNVQITAND